MVRRYILVSRRQGPTPLFLPGLMEHVRRQDIDPEFTPASARPSSRRHGQANKAAVGGSRVEMAYIPAPREQHVQAVAEFGAENGVRSSGGHSTGRTACDTIGSSMQGVLP